LQTQELDSRPAWSAPMLPVGPAQRVTVFVGESHHYHGRSAYMAVFDYLFHHRIAGATITRGIAGFGAQHHIHTADMLAASENLPIKIEFVEQPEKVRELLPKIRDMIGDGMITVQPVEIYFAGTEPKAAAAPPPAHLALRGPGKLMRIYVGEKEKFQGRPLHEAVVESLRAHDIAGVTVYRGIAGYGAGERLGKGHGGVPIMLSVVDTEERIRAYLPYLEPMLTRGVVVLSDVEVLKYAHGDRGAKP
jgi:PII-like signaling protein